MKYQWFLFDADDTLFDYGMAEANSLEQTFRDLNLVFPENCAQAYRRINQQVWQDFEKGLISPQMLRTQRFVRLFEELGIVSDAEVFSKQYLANLSRQTVMVEGAEALLRALHPHARLAVITNGFSEVQHSRLSLSPVANLFAGVFVSEEIGAAKPDAAFYDAVFARIGSPAREQVLVIGDSLSSDMQGGINYEVDTCWFNPLGKSRSDGLPITYEIQQLAQLLKLPGILPDEIVSGKR